jgi:hypothetical protein
MTFNLDDYEPVASRLARWREQIVSEGFEPIVETELINSEPGKWCVFKATLFASTPRTLEPVHTMKFLVATGWAEEHVTERGVNSTSHVENCETSAVGRALANAGFAGSDPSKRPSREEMTKVQRAGGQPAQYGNKPAGVASEKQRQFIADLLAKRKPPMVAQLPSDLSFADASKLIESLKRGELPAMLIDDEEVPF